MECVVSKSKHLKGRSELSCPVSPQVSTFHNSWGTQPYIFGPHVHKGEIKMLCFTHPDRKKRFHSPREKNKADQQNDCSWPRKHDYKILSLMSCISNFVLNFTPTKSTCCRITMSVAQIQIRMALCQITMYVVAMSDKSKLRLLCKREEGGGL